MTDRCKVCGLNEYGCVSANDTYRANNEVHAYTPEPWCADCNKPAYERVHQADCTYGHPFVRPNAPSVSAPTVKQATWEEVMTDRCKVCGGPIDDLAHDTVWGEGHDFTPDVRPNAPSASNGQAPVSDEALEMALEIYTEHWDPQRLAAALQKLMDERDDRAKYARACEAGAAHWKQRAEAVEKELDLALRNVDREMTRAEAAEKKLSNAIIALQSWIEKNMQLECARADARRWAKRWKALAKKERRTLDKVYTWASTYLPPLAPPYNKLWRIINRLDE